MPALWEAGQKLLRHLQPAFTEQLFVNDVAYVESNGEQQVMHRDLRPLLCQKGKWKCEMGKGDRHCWGRERGTRKGERP